MLPPNLRNIETAYGATPSAEELGTKAVQLNTRFANANIAPTRTLAEPERVSVVDFPAPMGAALPQLPSNTTPVTPTSITPSAQLGNVLDVAAGMAVEDVAPFPNGTVTTGVSPFTGEKIPVIHVSGANIVDDSYGVPPPGAGPGAPPPPPPPTAPPLVSAPPSPKSKPPVAAIIIGLLLLGAAFAD